MIMSSANTMTEKKLKSAAKRLPQELSAAGVDASSLGYAKILDVLSKSLFGKPYTEVKATLLVSESTEESQPPVIVEILHGNNVILAVDGCYYTATNPGTDMEIPYHALSARSADIAARHNVGVVEADLTGLCLEADSDDEVVEMAIQMGFFRPEGSIFAELEGSGLMLVDGHANEIGLHLNWRELVEHSNYPEGEVIWLTRTYPNGQSEPVICEFTFGDLCAARKQGDAWIIEESRKRDADNGSASHRAAFKWVSVS
jgi:hypothetical protein